ncbi:MAG: hypothetical protein IPG92_01825 [Flavobacteriales bacterium]|nr:hypothetical protein [Flavobacteriales bacterium]
MLVFGTELRQLLRVPELIVHFLDHRSEEPNMSLTDFLWIHYCTEQVHDHDFHEDEELPFRSHDNVPTLIVLLDVLPVHNGEQLIPPSATAPVFPVCDLGVLAGEHAAVWQPPRA